MILSVIIVIKDPGNDLYATFSSLSVLNSPEVEIILKDNSSEKRYSEINNQFGYLNFRYVHKSDKGIYDAMNQAIDLAKGEFLYFLNSGDQHLDCNLIDILRESNSKTGYYFGHIVQLYPNTKLIKYPSRLSKYFVYFKNVCHQSIVYRASVFEELGLYQLKLPVNADFVFNMHMIHRFKGTQIDSFISIYRGFGVSYNYKPNEKEKIIIRENLKILFNSTEFFILNISQKVFRFLIRIKNLKNK